MKRKYTERELEIHCARVWLAEARRRRGQDFAKTLLQWAKNARNRANALRHVDASGQRALRF